MPSLLRNRDFPVALLAIIAGAGALWLLAELGWGTMERLGPAVLPGGVAIVLLAAGLWLLLHTALLAAPKRRAQEGWRWQSVLPWLLLAALVALSYRPPSSLVEFRTGAAENMALMLLLLTVMLVVSAIAEDGSLARPVVAMALAALVALGDLDQPGGVTRLWDDEPNFVHGVIAAAIVAALRLSLPGFILAYALALPFEDALRRGLSLAHGDVLALLIRPWSAPLITLAVVMLVIVLALRLRNRRRR